MPIKPSKQSGPKAGGLQASLTVPALEVRQGDIAFYVFKLKASKLWPMVSINRRSETEDRGYQRVLSNARVKSVADHIRNGQPLPNSVLVALDSGKYDSTKMQLTIPKGEDVGWVIDGQHRIAGAHEAAEKTDIELCVFAFIGVDEEFQIEQFVTINREQKGVPTSLVYDLLSHLPSRKKPLDVANERAAEIANELRHDKEFALFGRIVVTQSPGKGQISITNFVRKSPRLCTQSAVRCGFILLPKWHKLFPITLELSKPHILINGGRPTNIFFLTVGFGAMMNMFEEIFQIALSTESGFSISDIKKTIKGISNFDFSQWKSYGSGNKAEMEAAQDFRTDFNRSRATFPGNYWL